jgi:endonuclease YncB( thermonuclease family)
MRVAHAGVVREALERRDRVGLAVLLLVVAVLVLPDRSAEATKLRGRVVAVGDGDDITMLTDRRQRVRVRLVAIDAPERRQPFGDRTRQIVA